MVWYIPVFLRLVTAYIFFPFVQKRIAGLHSGAKRLCIMFSFCCAISILSALIFGASLTAITLLIVTVGIMNAFGAYCQWRAVDISLSRNSLFTIWDDIIAMSMSYFFLGESRFINSRLMVGILLSFSMVFLFILSDFKAKIGKEKKARINPVFYGYVLGYSIIWGLANFFMKYWAVKTVPMTNFLLGWYSGAFMGSLIIFKLMTKNTSNKSAMRLKKKDIFIVFILGSLALTSLGLAYWSFKLAPQIVIQPIFLVGEMTLPALTGLFIFKERRGYTIQDWIYLGISIFGGYLVSTSI